MPGESLLLRFWRKSRHTVLDSIYPRDCLNCFAPVGENSSLQYLCEECLKYLEIFVPPQCNQCGLPFYGIVTAPRQCPHCVELDPVYDRGHTAFRLKSPARPLVHALKYNHGRYALPDLVKIAFMAPATKDFLAGAVLVPVPLHLFRKWKRTYNQTELIAQSICGELENTVVEPVLERIRWTRTQTILTHAERQNNLKNAFALRKKSMIDPNKRYVVVDDVFTTGATLNACCKVMRKAGATKLDIFALGHG
jgi:ComF family protein